MANVEISGLPLATASTGPDYLVIVQGGATKKITNTSIFTNASLTTPTLTSPTLVTPVLGVATATSVNKVTITTPATAATLTIANNKTLTASNSITLAGVDGKTLTLGANLTFAGIDGKSLTVSNSLTLAGVDGKTLTINKSLTFDGTDGVTISLPTTNATMARTDAAQTFTGLQTFTTGIIGGVQALSGAGAINLTTLTTRYTSTATGNALTLADGSEGQLKFIVYYAEAAGADTGILTPTNLGAGTTITFTSVGNACLLQFIGTDWWVISNYGCTVA